MFVGSPPEASTEVGAWHRCRILRLCRKLGMSLVSPWLLPAKTRVELGFINKIGELKRLKLRLKQQKRVYKQEKRDMKQGSWKGIQKLGTFACKSDFLAARLDFWCVLVMVVPNSWNREAGVLIAADGGRCFQTFGGTLPGTRSSSVAPLPRRARVKSRWGSEPSGC